MPLYHIIDCTRTSALGFSMPTLPRHAPTRPFAVGHAACLWSQRDKSVLTLSYHCRHASVYPALFRPKERQHPCHALSVFTCSVRVAARQFSAGEKKRDGRHCVVFVKQAPAVCVLQLVNFTAKLQVLASAGEKKRDGVS